MSSQGSENLPAIIIKRALLNVATSHYEQVVVAREVVSILTEYLS